MDKVDEVNDLGRGLHVAHLNVRSLLGGSTFDMLSQQVKDSNIDVFTVVESWLTSAIPDKVASIKGYTLIRLDRAWAENEKLQTLKRGGGVMVYIKEGMNYSDLKHADLNVSCRDLEMIWVNLFIDNVRPIVIVTVYKPPQGNYKKML